MRPFFARLVSLLVGVTVPAVVSGAGCSSSNRGASGDAGPDVTLDATVQPAVNGLVADTSGTPLAGVGVRVGTATTTTGADGKFALTIAASPGDVFAFRKTGYVGRTLIYNVGMGAQVELYIQMLAESPAQPLNATTGGTVTGPRGSSLTIPPMSLVDGSGKVVTGTVLVSLTPIDPSVPAELEAYPAGLEAHDKAGNDGYLSTYGVLDIQVTQGAQTLNLKPGAIAHAEIPAPLGDATPPASVASWSLDETTGIWNEEGLASLDAATHLYAISLPHLSEWNCDVFNRPGCIYAQLVDQHQKPIANATVEAFVKDDLSIGGGFSDQNGYVCVVMAVDESGTTFKVFPHPQKDPFTHFDKFIGALPNHQVSSSIFMCNDPTECAQLGKLKIDTSRSSGSDGSAGDTGGPVDGPSSDGSHGGGSACTLGKDAGGKDSAGATPFTGCLAGLNAVFECFTPGGSCTYSPDSSTMFTSNWANGSKIQWTTTGSTSTGILYGPTGTTCGEIVSGSVGGATLKNDSGDAWLFSSSEAGADGGESVTCELSGKSPQTVTISSAEAGTAEACSGGFGLGAGGSACTLKNPVGAPCPKGPSQCTSVAPDCCMGKDGPLCLPTSACATYQKDGCGKDTDCAMGDSCCKIGGSPFPICLPIACASVDGGSPPPTDSGTVTDAGACTITLTGALTETFPCTVSATYTSLAGTTVSISDTTGTYSGTTTVLLPNPPVAMTSYTPSNTHVADTVIQQAFDGGVPDGGKDATTVEKQWQQDYVAPSTPDAAPSTDIGAFTLYISDTGVATTKFGVTTYAGMHGTFTALLISVSKPDGGPFVNMSIAF